MAQSLHIVSDPDVPRLGEEVTLSVHINGEPVVGTRHVDWDFQQRDDTAQHWPFDHQGQAKITIPSWSSDHHGTYYAQDRETGKVAARTIPPALRVALSGGGYRATLFSLGALLYLVEIDAQHRIEDVTSVSGGSIANSIVLERCDLSTTTRDEFLKVISDVAARTTRSRFLPRSRLPEKPRIVLRLVTGVAPLIALWLLFGLRMVAVALLLLCVLLMFRGLTVGRMLKRRFKLTSHLDERRRRVSHIFCATDLVEGEPFFFLATLGGGFFYSRHRGAARATSYPVHKAVRGSAAFPLAFLPKRVGLRKQRFAWHEQPGRPATRFEGAAAFCADGGVANNFGTQWFEEQDPDDWPYRLIFGSPLAAGARWQPARETIDIAVDASIPIKPTGHGWFTVPILAELRSISRVMRVLYENTLRPRRDQATWAESVLEEKGYSMLVEEYGAAVIRRGTHRRVLVPLDAALLRQAMSLTARQDLVFTPPKAQLRGAAIRNALREVGVINDEGDGIDVLARAQGIPTTLFKRSRGETSDALLAGYLAALISCHTYEDLGIPPHLADTVRRLQSFVAGAKIAACYRPPGSSPPLGAGSSPASSFGDTAS